MRGSVSVYFLKNRLHGFCLMDEIKKINVYFLLLDFVAFPLFFSPLILGGFIVIAQQFNWIFLFFVEWTWSSSLGSKSKR